MSRKLSQNDIDKFHDYGLYIPSRTIYMGSEIVTDDGESGVDALMAARIIKNLNILEALSKDPITVLLNNPGGDVNHGLAIYDAVKACKSHVTMVVYGHAMSMGSVILQAADDRIMTPNSSQMIHYGNITVDREARTSYKIVDEMRRIDKWMEGVYMEKIKEKQPRFTLSRLKGMLTNDTFLTADKSVELGLADKILNSEGVEE